MALALTMALQELTTNAVNYGALSNEAGQIRICWSIGGSDTPHLDLRWEEHGGQWFRLRRGGALAPA